MIIAGINQAIGMPEIASEHGEMVNHMLEMVHWFMGFLFVGWTAFMIYVIAKFRRAKNPRANYYGVTSHTSTHLEVGVVIIEAVLLLGFAYPLWAKRVEDLPLGEDVVKIRAVGQQFGWNFHYAGPDGQMGMVNVKEINSGDNPIGLRKADVNGRDDFISYNELVLPKDRPVVIQVTSKDVIHGLAIIPLMAQQDAIPGKEIPMWMVPTKTGEWDIVCAQLCGAGHAKMAATVRVVKGEEYDEWFAGRTPLFGPIEEEKPAAAPAAPPVASAN
jgi:cytochrome c oxidase subunit 2